MVTSPLEAYVCLPPVSIQFYFFLSTKIHDAVLWRAVRRLVVIAVVSYFRSVRL